MNETQMVDALREAYEQSKVNGKVEDDGALSTKQVMAMMGMSRSKALDLIHWMIEEGLAQPDKVWRANPWGDRRNVPVIRLVGGEAGTPDGAPSGQT